jgi:hypothetical protein
MDHQDWPGWPEDDPHLDGPDVDDVGAVDPGQHDGGFDHVDHDPFGDDPVGHDPVGHDLADVDPFAADHGGFDDAAHQPLPGFDADTPDGGEDGHVDAIGGVYPDDDPFAPVHHATHDATTDHVPDQHAGTIVHDDPVPDQADPADYPVGADPDLAPDTEWQDPAYPPPLDLLHPPEPVDGLPWSDPRLLGTDITDAAVDDGGGHDPSWQRPHIGDLYDYAGDEQPPGSDGWQALLGSDDPAAEALARWWAPDS